MTRNMKCVMQGTTKKVIPHNEFMHRIRKTFYFGNDSRGEQINISRPLAEYASDLFSEPYKGHSLNRFYFGDLPSFCPHAPPCSLIMALIYLDRLSIIDPCYVRRITPQELFVVSMMISTKFYCGHDEEFYLSDWAEDGDMTEERLKELELEFLCAIEWNIYISNEQFFEKLCSIEKTLAQREGVKRGWLTYTELIQLLPSFALAKFIIQNIAVMLVSYAASVITIAGAFFLASQIPGNALHRETMATLHKTTIAGSVVSANESVPLTTKLQPVISSGTNENGTMVINSASAENLTHRVAFNVQDELIKLEEQYREELSSYGLHWRRHGIDSDSRWTLSKHMKIATGLSNGKQSREHRLHSQRNWLSLKSEYSDEVGIYYGAITNDEPTNFILSDFANCTRFMFWQTFTNVAPESLVRLPIFKLHS